MYSFLVLTNLYMHEVCLQKQVYKTLKISAVFLVPLSQFPFTGNKEQVPFILVSNSISTNNTCGAPACFFSFRC